MQATCLVGLGNPGSEYENTYHNVGWEFLAFLDGKLAAEHGSAAKEHGKNFHYQKYGELRLVYPDTFMNESGVAVAGALTFFKKTAADVVVFQDDSDLALGEWKETRESGAAGHHGIESIQKVLGDIPFLRVRIGIRDPREKTGEHPRRKAGEFVLHKISATERKLLEEKVFEPLAARYLSTSA